MEFERSDEELPALFFTRGHCKYAMFELFAGVQGAGSHVNRSFQAGLKSASMKSVRRNWQ
jgi:hypothetical protein